MVLGPLRERFGQGLYPDCVTWLRQHEEMVRLDLPPSEVLEAFLMGTRSAYHASELFQARAWSQIAVDVAESLHDATKRAEALYVAGTTYTTLGDAYEAVPRLQEAIALNPVGRWRPAAHFNIGQSYRINRRYVEAADAFGAAAELWQAQGNRQRAARGYHEAAWCLLLAGRVAEAEPLVERAVELYGDEPGERGSSDRLRLEAFLLMHQGQYDAAFARCQTVLSSDIHGQDDYGMAEAALIAAEILCRTGQGLKEASRLVQFAFGLKGALHHSYLMSWACDLRSRLGMIHETAD